MDAWFRTIGLYVERGIAGATNYVTKTKPAWGVIPAIPPPDSLVSWRVPDIHDRILTLIWPIPWCNLYPRWTRISALYSTQMFPSPRTAAHLTSPWAVVFFAFIKTPSPERGLSDHASAINQILCCLCAGLESSFDIHWLLPPYCPWMGLGACRHAVAFCQIQISYLCSIYNRSLASLLLDSRVLTRPVFLAGFMFFFFGGFWSV